MSAIDNLRDTFGDYAKDIKVNLGNILSEEADTGLSKTQIYGTALACSYATKCKELIDALEEDAKSVLSPEEVNAVKASATIMGMNNIYYRFVHLVSDKEYGKMAAGLRMTVIANPGIDKKDFELFSLAVSAINGCGMCIDSHVHQLEKHGMDKKAIQSSIRIAAIINAAAQTIVIG